MTLQIGHINYTFPETTVTKENGSQRLDCPYNFRHQISFADFALHLERCPETAIKKDKVERCRFNSVHFYPAKDADRRNHEAECPNRRNDVPVDVVKQVIKPKVPIELPPLRQRIGVENPRVPQPLLPPIREVLGASLRFPEMEKLMAELKLEASQRPPDTGEYRIDGMNAYEWVMKSSIKSYGACYMYTSKMSNVEKNQFSRFLEDQKLQELDRMEREYTKEQRRIEDQKGRVDEVKRSQNERKNVPTSQSPAPGISGLRAYYQRLREVDRAPRT